VNDGILAKLGPALGHRQPTNGAERLLIDGMAQALMFTTYDVIDRLGAEGWEAFHIEKTRANVLGSSNDATHTRNDAASRRACGELHRNRRK
jgi:hypothetical protein